MSINIYNDLVTGQIISKKRILKFKIYTDTGGAVRGVYEPYHGFGFKVFHDGHVYLDENLTLPLTYSPIYTRPTSGTAYYDVHYIGLNPDYVVMTYCANNYNTIYVIVFSRDAQAVLVYNPSPNDVTVRHQDSIYPYYETNGTYSEKLVTLSQGKYVLFYKSRKPTVNQNAPWGFTDAKPVSSTTKPSRFIYMRVHGTDMYWVSDLVTPQALNRDEAYPSNYMLVHNPITRANMPGDVLDTMPGPGCIYLSSQGTSWWGSYTFAVSYIETENEGAMIYRLKQMDLSVPNIRSTLIHGIAWSKDLSTLRHLVYAYTDTSCVAYGSPNQTDQTCIFRLERTLTSPTPQYTTDGSTWNNASWVSGSWTYYTGVRAWRGMTRHYRPIFGGDKYFIMKRLRTGGTTSPTHRGCIIGTTEGTTVSLQIDHGGATIPAGNWFYGIGEIKFYDSLPTEEVPGWEVINEEGIVLYGYPHDLSVTVSGSSITVSTSAPDGTTVYLINKANGTIVGTANVSNGTATFTNVSPGQYRIIVAGLRPTLVSQQ